MKVTFFALDRKFGEYREQFLSAMEEALKTGQMVNGPAVYEFEEKLCKLIDRKYAVAVGSATDGLAFILQALNIKEGDEVLVPAYSFIARVEVSMS